MAKKPYQMLFCGADKQIFLDKCCFCSNAVITNRCNCTFHLPLDDACPKFELVESTKVRLHQLIANLPDDYDGVVYLTNHTH